MIFFYFQNKMTVARPGNHILSGNIGKDIRNSNPALHEIGCSLIFDELGPEPGKILAFSVYNSQVRSQIC